MQTAERNNEVKHKGKSIYYGDMGFLHNIYFFTLFFIFFYCDNIQKEKKNNFYSSCASGSFIATL